MSLYNNKIYPWLIHKLADPQPIQTLRQQVLPLAKGIVLEIGTGPGVNFTYYTPNEVSLLYALEPNKGMVKYAEQQRRKTTLNVEYLDLPGEQIPLQDDSVDTVVSTFTLGSIEGIEKALKGIHRVLKPNGVFLFCEVGQSPDPIVQRWQRRWKPITKLIFQGLDLNKNISTLIEQNGFTIEKIESSYFDETSNASKAWTYCSWGIAKPLF